MNTTELFERIGRVLSTQIAPLFKRDIGMTFTFIARCPGDNEADVFISSDDDIDELIALLQRSKTRDGIVRDL
jgi:hypothetical protein